MRILTLIHEFPPVGGGGGRVAQDIARELARRGHQVTVLAPYIKGLPFNGEVDGVQVIRLPSLRKKPYSAGLLAMSTYLVVGFVVGLWRILRSKPDVIHVHFAVPAGALAWLLSRLTGIHYVLTVHLGDVPGGVPEKTEQWFHWVYPFTPRIWKDAKFVTAISEYTRQLALRHYPVPIQVIPNAIQLDGTLSSDMLTVAKPPRIVFAGRLVEQKNPVHIIRILDAIRELPWQAQLIGDGDLFEAVDHEILRLGLQDRILLTGWMASEGVAEILAQSDILLLPSLSEGIPMVSLQALSKGLAIVASHVGGLSDVVVDGKNGFLHDAHDTVGFVESLRYYLSDRNALLMAKRESLQILHRFDLGLAVDKYEQALQSAAERRKFPGS